MAGAEAGDVVFVAAEGLVFGGFELVGAVLLIDYLPDHFVRGHAKSEKIEWVKQGKFGLAQNTVKVL